MRERETREREKLSGAKRETEDKSDHSSWEHVRGFQEDVVKGFVSSRLANHILAPTDMDVAFIVPRLFEGKTWDKSFVDIFDYHKTDF